jgi:uncharacterized protein (TIGR02145 family)
MSGFSALPAGYRTRNNGNYANMGKFGFFWSSSEDGSNFAWTREENYNTSRVLRLSFVKQYGFSIRCLGD